ncbi:hypothetical protein FK513_28200, partial [Klebsiella pneumoniae]|nr:hypothetical protein [Klebsiella pneumoniae]
TGFGAVDHFHFAVTKVNGWWRAAGDVPLLRIGSPGLRDAATIADQDKFRALSREYAQLSDVARCYTDWRQVQEQETAAEGRGVAAQQQVVMAVGAQL